jgi:hypothetical protein
MPAVSSPGPGAYMPDEARTKLAKRSPAYTMGSPRAQPASGTTLGPGEYGEVDAAKQRLLRTSPSYTMGLKSAKMVKAQSMTDLGAYSPERGQIDKASPRYSMGVRYGLSSADPMLRKACKGKDSPGPGAYQPSPSPSSARASPRYTIGQPIKRIPTTPESTPAPGAYQPSPSPSSARASPRYTFGQPIKRIPATSESTPGPGSYGTAASKPSMADASKNWLKCARPSTAAKMGRVEHMC